MGQPSLIKFDTDAAVAEARRWVGVKWGHRQRGPRRIDCIGLVIKAAAAGGIMMQDRLDYGRTPWNDGLERELENAFGQPLPKEEMQHGDVALLIGNGQPAPGHVGIIATGDNGLNLIHSYNALANELVTEHSIDSLWLSRIVQVYRP